MVRGIGILALIGAVLLAFGPLAGGIPEDVPEAARRALAEQLGSHVASGVERGAHNGVQLFEAEWDVDGREHTATVTETGELVETEQELPAEAVTERVRGVAAALMGSATVEFARRTFVAYEASAVVDGVETEVLILPTGAIMASPGYDDGPDDDDGDDDDGDDDDGDDDDDDDDGDDDDETVVPLDQVPAEVTRAAGEAVPGAVWTAAISEIEGGVLVYELEGTVDGKPVEIEITAQGTVLEIEGL